MAQGMNTLGYSAMTLGNHEFDNGLVQLVSKFIGKLKFPVLAANILVTLPKPGDKVEPAVVDAVTTFKATVKPYTTFPKLGVAVIGLLSANTPDIAPTGPYLQFISPEEAARKYVQLLQKAGYKRILVLSHCGYAEDMALAKKVAGLDIIVGGHSHTLLATPEMKTNGGGSYPTIVKDPNGQPTYIVQMGSWGKYAGYFDATFDTNGTVESFKPSPVLLDNTVEQDKMMVDTVSKWREPFQQMAQTVVGQATDAFSQNGCSGQECALGNLLADSMVYVRRPDKSNVDPKDQVRAAFLNTGGIRAGINAGPIKWADVMSVLPFGNTLRDLVLTGKQLKDIFEGVLAQKNKATGKPIQTFLQVSGLYISHDPSREAFSRVVSMDIAKSNGSDEYEAVQDDQRYRIVTIEFLATGGGNFIPPLDSASDATSTTLIQLLKSDEALVDYLAKFSPISPKLENRIRRV
jgi:5'-nucleotidase